MNNPNQVSLQAENDPPADSSKPLEESLEITVKQSGEPAAGSPADFSRFRLSQNFGSVSGVRKKLTTVPVRKPLKTQFVRVHSENKLDTMLLKYGDNGEDLYLIDPDVMQEVGNLAKPYRLVEAIDRQNNVFVWPLAIPDGDRPLNWHLSAMDAASHGEVEWIRMQANMSLGAYDVFVAEQNLGEPEWPELSMNELLEIAFKNKIINRPDHLVLLQLRGAA